MPKGEKARRNRQDIHNKERPGSRKTGKNLQTGLHRNCGHPAARTWGLSAGIVDKKRTTHKSLSVVLPQVALSFLHTKSRNATIYLNKV